MNATIIMALNLEKTFMTVCVHQAYQLVSVYEVLYAWIATAASRTLSSLVVLKVLFGKLCGE